MCINVCSIWKDIYSAPENSKKNMKHRNGFLYLGNLNKQWRLILRSALNAEGNNFFEVTFAIGYGTTVGGEMDNTMKALTDKFKCQYFACLVRKYVRSGDIFQRTKYLQRGPIGYITTLYILVRP